MQLCMHSSCDHYHYNDIMVYMYISNTQRAERKMCELEKK